jgi:hypothetical protein
MSWHKEPRGFVSFAINTIDTDYLELAYTQALCIKATQDCNRYAVIVDAETKKLINQRHLQAFDYVIDCESVDNAFSVEPQVLRLTPFKETIKLEADLLFTRSIDHWWTAFRLKDVCLSTHVRNYQQQLSDVRKYRQAFDANNLPDVYNGLMYFRFSQLAVDFFRCASQIFLEWDAVKSSLRDIDGLASTDVVYAIAAQIIGEESVTLPSCDFINFVHMKPAINGYPESNSFRDVFVSEFDSGMIRINNINQYHPIHYHEKDFVTEEICEYFRSRISQSS